MKLTRTFRGSEAREVISLVNVVITLTILVRELPISARFTGPAETAATKAKAVSDFKSCMLRDVRYKRVLARGRQARDTTQADDLRYRLGPFIRNRTPVPHIRW